MAGQELELVTPSALEAITRSEVDIQVETAKKYPRDVQKALDSAKKLVCLDRDTAAECHYSLPRGGKVIEGPSVRLAEIIASRWCNLRIASRIMDIGEREVTCQAVCHDLETNVAVSTEIKRRITNRNGQRYNDDMIAVTSNAGCAIAFRNAIFRIIPKAVWAGVYDAALERMRSGGDLAINEKRKRAVGWFVNQGATEKAIFSKLGIQTINQITNEHLVTLRGMYNAVQEGTTTIEELFDLNSSPAPRPTPVTQETSETPKPPRPTPVAPQAQTEPPQQKPEKLVTINKDREPASEVEEEDAEEGFEEPPEDDENPTDSEEQTAGGTSKEELLEIWDWLKSEIKKRPDRTELMEKIKAKARHEKRLQSNTDIEIIRRVVEVAQELLSSVTVAERVEEAEEEY